MAPIDYSIKDIEKIVHFEGKVKNVEISRLTPPGENYVSLVLRVDFEIEKNGHSKTINSIAKRMPLSTKKEDNFGFNGMAMKNEIRWYCEMIPLLKNFAKENSIKTDFYPEYHGSRYSLDSAAKNPDHDGVLLIENLIPQGYQNDDRYIGFDLDTSKAILKNLALFHAVPIAMKVKNPELFKTVKDFVDTKRPESLDKNDDDPSTGKKKLEDVLLDVLGDIRDCAPYMTKIKSTIDNMGPDMFSRTTTEPWNTITHNDFWVNNIMVNHKTGKEPLVKIVDFQLCNYGTFAKDLVFFLLSSIRNDVTKEYMDDLLRFYYDKFTSSLRAFDVNLEFTYEEYLEEVRSTASAIEFGHALFFTSIIFGEKGTGIDVAVEEFDDYDHMTQMIKNMNEYRKNKIVLIASEAIKRNWI